MCLRTLLIHIRPKLEYDELLRYMCSSCTIVPRFNAAVKPRRFQDDYHSIFQGTINIVTTSHFLLPSPLPHAGRPELSRPFAESTAPRNGAVVRRGRRAWDLARGRWLYSGTSSHSPRASLPMLSDFHALSRSFNVSTDSLRKR